MNAQEIMEEKIAEAKEIIARQRERGKEKIAGRLERQLAVLATAPAPWWIAYRETKVLGLMEMAEDGDFRLP